MRWVRRGVGGLLLVGVGVCPGALQAQTATLSNEMAVLGANALVGGVSAGVVAWLKGRSFAEGFTLGAVGGSAQYLGKRIAVGRWTGAGLAGRLVGVTGASMVRNGVEGRGAFDRLIVPVGPFTLHWTTRGDSARLEPKIDVGRTIFLTWLIVDPKVRIDWGATLSAGAPIFEAPKRVLRGEGGSVLGGEEMWGTITVSDVGLLPEADRARLLSHERVHVVQDDFLNFAWAGPIESWIFGQIDGGKSVHRYVDVGLAYVGIAGVLLVVLPYQSRPWESEAYYMESRR